MEKRFSLIVLWEFSFIGLLFGNPCSFWFDEFFGFWFFMLGFLLGICRMIVYSHFYLDFLVVFTFFDNVNFITDFSSLDFLWCFKLADCGKIFSQFLDWI
jgi:hypothetical protein